MEEGAANVSAADGVDQTRMEEEVDQKAAMDAVVQEQLASEVSQKDAPQIHLRSIIPRKGGCAEGCLGCI